VLILGTAGISSADVLHDPVSKTMAGVGRRPAKGSYRPNIGNLAIDLVDGRVLAVDPSGTAVLFTP
jgi:hypothetical protein